MRKILVLAGLVTAILLIWTLLAYLMDNPAFSSVFPASLASAGVFLLLGVLNQYLDRRHFRKYLESKRVSLNGVPEFYLRARFSSLS